MHLLQSGGSGAPAFCRVRAEKRLFKPFAGEDDNEYTVVIGAVNTDIWGLADGSVIPEDSNPGRVFYAPGGVGRNIAHNLSLLSEHVEMLTALSDDLWGQKLSAHLSEIGVGLREALRVPDGQTSVYLYVTGADRNLYVGVCDAHIQDDVTPEVLRDKLPFLNAAKAVVLDGNLTAETIRYAISNVTAPPIFANPVSTTKAKKFLGNLRGLHAIKPNLLEAEALTGEHEPAAAAKKLVEAGVKHAFVSAAEEGIYYAEREKDGHIFVHRVPMMPAKVRNVTGGGDAVMAALVKAHILGMTTEEAARFAMAAGSITVESEEANSDRLSVENVKARMNNESVS